MPQTLFIQTDNSYLQSRYAEKSFAAYKGDAGIDIYCPSDIVIKAKETKCINFEIRCQMEDENNYTMSYWLLPRSSISKTSLRMSNSIGLIDQDYLGKIMSYVDNISNEDVFIEKGTRLFQIVSPTLTPLVVKLTDSFKDTERGEKGFGSSGK